MNKYKEALQKIAKLNSNYKYAVSIATEALEPTEPRMFSEEEVINIVDKWVRYQEEVGDGKSIPIKEFIQSLSPKEGKPSGIDLEKLQNKADKIFEEETIESFNEWLKHEQSKREIEELEKLQPLEPNQTEVEKEEVRKFVYLIEDTHPSRQGLYFEFF